MALVYNSENSIKISSKEYLTKSSNRKKWKRKTPFPLKISMKKRLLKAFLISELTKLQLKFKRKRHKSDCRDETGEKKKIVQKVEKSKETIFLVGDIMLKKVDGYLLTNSSIINF